MLRKIRVGCPACRTQLSVQCADDDLVHVKCPDCNKRFAARVPQTGPESFDDPLSSFNEHIWTAPPKQRRPVRKDPNDDFVQKLVIAVLVMICSGAIVIPLGIVAYYVYKGYSTEVQQMAQNSPTYANDTSNSTYQPGTFRPSGTVTPPPAPSNPGNTETTYGTNAFAQPPDGSTNPSMTYPRTDAQPNPGTMNGNGPVSPGPVTPGPMMPTEDPNGGLRHPSFNNPSGPPTPGPNMTPQKPNPTQPNVTVVPGNSGTGTTGLSENLRKFAGKDGVFIFVVGAQSSQVGQAINQLTDTLSINDRAVEVQSDHTVIGLRYSGPLDNVSKNFRYGRIFFIDEDSRTIHVRGN